MATALQLANKLLRYTGLALTPAKNLQMVYQHDYRAGGYERYRSVQILHNRRKIDKVWADSATLAIIAEYLRSSRIAVASGICHGTRRGFEQAELARLLDCPVIGTEISETAADFPNTVQWDFHDVKPEWRDAFSFVYSNSLDQAFAPRRALDTWVGQLQPDGLLFIEHSLSHAAMGAGEMDPFGAHPMAMPYLLFEWGRGTYRLVDLIRPEDKKRGKFELWLFVVGRVAAGAPL